MISESRGTNLRRVCVVVALSLNAVSCGGSLKSQISRKAAPAEAAAAAIQAYDTDGDGKLSLAELQKAPALRSGLVRLDANRDSVVTLDELQSRLQTIENGSDFIALAISVATKGRPLVGASVTLTPAPFMGAGLQSYTGTTVSGGSCQLQGTEARLPGLPVGYYEAKITNPQRNIDQIVGCEIADDASGSHLELKVN